MVLIHAKLCTLGEEEVKATRDSQRTGRDGSRGRGERGKGRTGIEKERENLFRQEKRKRKWEQDKRLR